MADVTWSVLADFDRSGTYETDLTSYVTKPGSGVVVDRGMGPDGFMRTSKLGVTFNNADGRFTAGKTDGAYYGQLDPGVPVQIKATHASAQEITETVAETADDGFEAIGTALATNQVAAGIVSSMEINGFLRFQGLAIAQGTPITQALLKLGVIDVAGTPNTTVYGVDEDDAAAFADPGNLPSNATRTAASTVFTPTGRGLASIDVTAIVQEIIDRAGWGSGNDIAFVMDDNAGSGTNYWVAHDVDDAGATAQLVVTFEEDVDYTLWTGYIQKWKRRWRAGTVPMAVAECVDIGEYLVNGARVNVTVSESRDTDGALIAIMDAVGLGSGDRDVEDGLQDLPFHFAQAQTPMEAMMAVVRSEMGGWLWINASGQLRFESRATRLGISVDDTWGDGTEIVPVEIDEVFDPLDFVTKVSVRTTVFAEGQADQEVFRVVSRSAQQPSDNSIALTAGQVYIREFSGAQGVSAFTTPVAETDYMANASADGSGADKTSDLDVTLTDLGGGRFRIRLENTDASTIYVTKFRLRGTQVAFYADRPEAVVELSRSDLPAGREVTVDVPFGGDDVYQPVEWAMTLMRPNRYAEPRLVLKYHGATDDEKVALLSLEIGMQILYDDRAMSASAVGGVSAPASYTHDWFRVEAIKYHIPPDWAGKDFLCEVTLSPQHLFRNLDAIAFDDFARDNATGDLGISANGVTWANDTGYNIVSGQARANTDTLSMATLNLGTGIVDQVVEAQLSNIGTGDEVGVVFRYTDADNQYRCYLDKGSNEVILEKNVATTVSEIASPAFTVGTAHEMRAMVQGERIRVWVDFELVIDTTDSALSAGTNVGLFARNASATTTFDNFYGQGL